jgi:hypothetical protein
MHEWKTTTVNGCKPLKQIIGNVADDSLHEE